MATLTSRTLSKYDLFDRKAIRVDSKDFTAKSGIIEVDLGNLVVTLSDCTGSAEVRVPNHSSVAGDLKREEVAIESATTDLDEKAYFAVNNGVPGPSVKVNDDGTWDLLWLTTRMDVSNEVAPSLSASVVYTVTFTDLTPSTTNPSEGNATATLAVGPNTVSAEAILGIATSTLLTKNGYIKAWINSTTQSVVPDIDSLESELAVFSATSGSDTEEAPGVTIVSHSLPKIAGQKVYTQAMYVFAINNGKIDGNGTMIAGNSPQGAAVKCLLLRGSDSADEISVDVSYNISFVEI